MLYYFRKIFIVLFISIFCFSWFEVFAAEGTETLDCSWQDWDSDTVSISDGIDNCLKWSALASWDDASVEVWLKENINTWTQALAMFLWIFSVWSIVYWGLLMTLSTGDDEKIKKAKDVVKWWMIGFICVISASAVILLVVNIMFSIWS